MARKMIVPSSDEVSKKWGEVTPGRAGYYEAKTPAAGPIWESNTIAAKSTFKTAVSAAGIENRFAGGVKRAGAAKFSRKVTAVGVGRFGPGISAAVEDMKSGVEPFLSVLAAIEIPDRGPRGDAGNYAIVQKVGDPLHKKRLALLGASS